MQSGHQTEHDSGDERDEHADREDAPVYRHVHPLRNVTARDREGQQRVCRPARQQHAERAAQKEQQRALDEHLPDETRPARPERRPDDALSRSRHGARQQEVGDVGARDEQHEAHGAEHQQQSLVGLAIRRRVVLVERRHAEAAPLVRSRIVQLEPAGDRLELGPGLRERHARLEAREDIEVAMASALRVLGRHQGLQEIAPVPQHVRRQHADDRERAVIGPESPADDVRVRGKMASPVGLGEEHDTVVAGPLVVENEPAAEKGLHAQGGEPPARHEGACDRLAGSAHGRDGEVRPVIGGDLLEHGGLVPDVHEIRKRDVVDGVRRSASPDLDQPPGILVRQGTEHNRVDDAEDRGVGADAERKGRDGHGGEPTVPAQHADGVEEILAQLIEKRAGPCIPHGFSDLLDPAKLDQGGAARLAVRHAGAAPLVGGHLDEPAQLVVQVLLDAVPEHQILQQAREAHVNPQSPDLPIERRYES